MFYEGLELTLLKKNIRWAIHTAMKLAWCVCEKEEIVYVRMCVLLIFALSLVLSCEFEADFSCIVVTHLKALAFSLLCRRS